jgi:hypothetical protein
MKDDLGASANADRATHEPSQSSLSRPTVSVPNALAELADRCEEAEGANKMLDETIVETVGIVPSRHHSFVYPHYAFTASIDAALTLVPEGWRVTHSGEGRFLRAASLS